MVSGSTSRDGWQNNPCHLWQHHDHCTDQQVWGNKITTLTQIGHQDLEPLHGNRDEDQHDLHTLTSQSSRCTIMQDEHATRMVNTHLILSATTTAMGATHHWFICDTVQQEGGMVHVMETRARSVETGCSQSLLEGPQEGLCLPSMVLSGSSLGEDSYWESEGNGHHTMVAKHGLVSNDFSNDDGTPRDDPKEHDPTGPRTQPTHTREEQDVVHDSLEHWWCQAISDGAGPEVIEWLFDLDNAWAQLKKQLPGQKVFKAFMDTWKWDPMRASPMDIANFLEYGLGMKKWEINTVRNYLSATMQLFPGPQQKLIQEHDSFKQYIHIMGKLSTKWLQHKTMDLELIKEELWAYRSNCTMKISQLTTKVCFLLLGCGIMQADDVQNINVVQSKFMRHKVELMVIYPKEKWEGRHIIKTVEVKTHKVEAFCPVRALQAYWCVTAMGDGQAQQPHQKYPDTDYTPLIQYLDDAGQGVTSETISNHSWRILSLIQEEGQPKCKLRAVGATKALQHGIPVDDVTVQGNWSNTAVLEAHYWVSWALTADFTKAFFS